METEDRTEHEHDSVDRILFDWAGQRPDLDFSPVGVVTRLTRVGGHLDHALAQTFAGFDLSPADFVVIVTLRRAGHPYRLPQPRLMADIGLTSGTVSMRLSRLERMGIVRRDGDPSSRRSRSVYLTEAGLELFDNVAPVHLAGEDRLLSALDPTERRQLADLLRKLLLSYEHVGDRAPTLWGMRLEPVHVARRRRAAVGLSDSPGLLVTDVAPHSPAALAGLACGDLIVGVAGQEVRAPDGLARFAEPGRPLDLDIRRGENSLKFTLNVSP